jgi:signal transduction histidine kinase
MGLTPCLGAVGLAEYEARFLQSDASSLNSIGIVLALVKRIIELYGGRIWVESAGQGYGCTVCFTLAEDKVATHHAK